MELKLWHKIVIQVFTTLILSFLLMLLGFGLGADAAVNLISGSQTFMGTVGWEAGATVGGLIGLILGSFLGCIALIKLMKVKGSVIFSFLGSVIGLVIILIINFFRPYFFMSTLEPLLPSIGSLLGYHYSYFIKKF